MTKNTKRLDGKKKLLTFTSRLESDMRSFCRDKGIESENELIRQAIGKYIYSDYQDETLKLQGTKQLQDKVTELHDMLEIIFSYLIKMHTNLLAYHPELDPNVKDAALASAVNRHDKLMLSFQDGLKNNPSLFECLLHSFFSEDSNG
jgi:hypothetical protein